MGVIARVPLASGLLTGKFEHDSRFAADDHRAYNRHGESFDVGETFSGVDFETGLEAVEELRPLVPEGATLAQFALRWILDFDAVSTTSREPRRRSRRARTRPRPSCRLWPTRRTRDRRRLPAAHRPQVHQRW